MTLFTDIQVRELGSNKFNYWFGYVANLSLVAWFMSYATPLMNVEFSPTLWLSWGAGGLVFWSLMEYAFHRYIYHEWTSFLQVGHLLHHEAPKAPIGVPWYLTTIAIVAIFMGLSSFLPAHHVGLAMGFTWLGYVIYCFVHYSLHHYNLDVAWFRALKKHHMIHHALNNVNWSVTVIWWDHLLGSVFNQDISELDKPSGHRSQGH